MFFLLGFFSVLSVRSVQAAKGDASSDLPAPVHTINAEVARAWKEQKVVPSQEAPDGAWCRRIYLDLIGRVPSVEELQTFLAERGRDKRARLVNRLLGDEYSEEYARNWTTIWTNLLIGRTGGTNNQSLADREGMRQYLHGVFYSNKNYKDLAQELITATGSCRPGDEDFNGAANFLADKLGEEGVQATAKTAEIFLGLGVQCTQCHNHPFNEYGQNQFWELNAYFRQTRAEPLETMMDNRRVARVVDQDFAGEGGDPENAEIYYELRNGKLKVAYPVFVDGSSLAEKFASQGENFGNRGWVSEVNRRQELAGKILQADQFSRAIVNRTWAHFFGHGFTKPIDDMGPHNPPSHPELLTNLADQFEKSGYDLKQLLKWIVLSEPYSLDSKIIRQNEEDDPAAGSRPLFSHFYLRQMSAEQLYDSLLVATGADAAIPTKERDEVKQRWLNQFNTAFGNDENGESTSFNGSIPQALVLMNGELVKKATSSDSGSFLGKIAWNEKLSNPQKINYLYLAALSRRPEREEVIISNQLLAARKGDVGAALQDIWWALLNSNEFILNH